LLSWSVNSDASGSLVGSQGAVASSSMATPSGIILSKDNQLYCLVVQSFFPAYHPDEIAMVNLPVIG
jgi:hypothetical protein